VVWTEQGETLASTLHLQGGHQIASQLKDPTNLEAEEERISTGRVDMGFPMFVVLGRFEVVEYWSWEVAVTDWSYRIDESQAGGWKDMVGLEIESER
jgi:hypothetical protein